MRQGEHERQAKVHRQDIQAYTSMKPRSGFRCGGIFPSIRAITGDWVVLWTGKFFTTRQRGLRIRATNGCWGLVAGVDTRRQQFLSEGPSQGQELRLFAETSNGLRGAYSGNFYRGTGRAHLPAGATVVSLALEPAYSQLQAEPIQLGGAARASRRTVLRFRAHQREFPLRGYRAAKPCSPGIARAWLRSSGGFRSPTSTVISWSPARDKPDLDERLTEAGAAWTMLRSTGTRAGPGAAL